MLKITKKLEYALIALRHMHLKGDVLSSSKEISQMYMLPFELLAKTLQQMARLGYIHAVQGTNGGYKLHQSLDKINLTNFIEEMEGPIGMVDCTINMDCIQMSNCNIRIPINKINEKYSIISNGYEFQINDHFSLYLGNNINLKNTINFNSFIIFNYIF